MASSQKVRGREPKTPGKPFSFPVSPVRWSSELLISPGTGQQQEGGGRGQLFPGKECARSPSLPAARKDVLPASRETNRNVLPCVFMRNVCSPIGLFYNVSDFPASLRGRRCAKKPLSVSQNSSVISSSHFSAPAILLSGEK